jgi:hypothetical protein
VDNQLQNNLHKLCDESILLSEELLNKLNGLRVRDGKHRGWESLKAAVRSAWSKDEVLSLRARLSTLKESLESRSLLSIQ